MATAARPRRRDRGLGWIALLLVVGVLGAVRCGGHDSDVPAAVIVTRPALPAPEPPRDATAPLAVRSAPVSLRIPTIGVTAVVGELGLNPDKTVQVPRHPQEAGWYRGGPAPGQLGSAVILGHVDSTTGPAVFYRLRSLHKGDMVIVTLTDGRITRFVVDRVRTYPNAEFPAHLIYGPHGFAGLQLITCGGRYGRSGYTANVVVFTTLVSTMPHSRQP